MNQAITTQPPITATAVPADSTLAFFKNQLRYDAPALSFSVSIEEFLQKHINDNQPVVSIDLLYAHLYGRTTGYKASPCQFYTLSNGGFYMAPMMDKLTIKVGEVSGDAAGIFITLSALADCIQKRITLRQGPDSKGCTADDDKLYDQYYALREYAQNHAESGMILGAN